MKSHINFIGRGKEIDDILEYLKGESSEPGKVVLISGDGGLGKTRLLEELPARIEKKVKGLTINQVIDFDDKKLNSPESINSSMIKVFGEAKFEDYYRSLEGLQKIERLTSDATVLNDAKKNVANDFIKAYNKLDRGKQIWIFDTVEKICEFDIEGKVIGRNEDIINDWIAKIKGLENTYFIFSGRPAGVDSIRKTFNLSKHNIDALSIELKKFSDPESRSYIEEKQKKLHISIKKEQSEKLIKLAEGKPILLDLAIEWFVREVDMNFLNEMEIPKKGYQLEDFERKLVGRINTLRPPINSLTFALAHVYPLDKEGFKSLFKNTSQKNIDFESLKQIVYIKTLPGGAIKLHDEMESLVEKYVFSSIDRSLSRRINYSNKYLSYLKKKYHDISKREYKAKQDATTQRREKEEKEMDLNWFTTQIIVHYLYADKEAGVQNLINWGVEEVKGKFKKGELITLLKELERCAAQLNLKEHPDFNIAYEELKSPFRKLDEDRTNLEKILEKAGVEQKIKRYFLLSNDAVRRGKLTESIKFLQKAASLNKQITNKEYSIKLDIEQGWNYRLIGDFEKAKGKYEDAIDEILELSEDGNWTKHPNLSIRYGWTLNNLAFALTNSNNTRRAAVDIANSAISHWKAINNKTGLGAGYSTSGITYYRIDNYENALKQFREALEIFEDLEHEEWLCQIYSWRGATYQDRAGADESAREEDLKRAENDFKQALELAEKSNRQIVPMTLNRLGRIDMTRKNWSKALERIKESLQQSKEMPDYLYWLGSIGRIGLIMPYYYVPEYTFEHLKQEYRDFEKEIREKGILADDNSMGITKIAFAYLEIIRLQKNPDEEKIEEIIALLKEGIPLIVEHGSYGRTDILSRLGFVENELRKVKPIEIIKKIGSELLVTVKEEASKNDSFLTAVNILNKWKNWNDDK